MKPNEVQVGGVYRMKVGTSVVPVKVTQEKWIGEKMSGWVGLNMDTRRSVRIETAQRLRGPVEGKAATAGAPDTGEVVLSDEAAVVVDRRTPAAAIPELKREAARLNAAFAAAGTPRPPAPPKGKGGKAAKEKSSKIKPLKAAKAAKSAKAKRMSGLDAAARVLAQARKPLNCSEMMEAIREKGLWKSGGKTPEATLYAAIIREIGAKGREARFKKVERGLFAATSHAAAAGK